MSEHHPKQRRWADLAEVCEYLRDSERHVRRLCEERRLPHTKLGVKLRFDLDQIDAWMDEQARAPLGER